jgi:hypothetical protein
MESECRDLQQQLDRHRQSLEAIISAVRSLVLFDNHRGPLRFIGEEIEVILNFRDRRLLQFSSEAVMEMGGPAQLVLSQASTSANPPTLEPIQSHDGDSLNDTKPTPTYGEAKADDGYEEIVRDSETKSHSEPICDKNCRCVCHTSQKLLPDDLLVPKASHPSLVARFMRACTMKECRKKKRRSKDTLIISSEVLKRTMGIKLIAKGFNRLFFLKTYPTVPENSAQIRYAASGNLEGLMLLVQMGRATANDSGPDGWSLLHVRTNRFSYRKHTYIDRPLLT